MMLFLDNQYIFSVVRCEVHLKNPIERNILEVQKCLRDLNIDKFTISEALGGGYILKRTKPLTLEESLVMCEEVAEAIRPKVNLVNHLMLVVADQARSVDENQDENGDHSLEWFTGRKVPQLEILVLHDVAIGIFYVRRPLGYTVEKKVYPAVEFNISSHPCLGEKKSTLHYLKMIHDPQKIASVFMVLEQQQ